MRTSELPPPPKLLQDQERAKRTKNALDKLYKACPSTFADVFELRRTNAGSGWDHLRDDLKALQEAGVLSESEERLPFSNYFITEWRGAYYLSDFPASGDKWEVFPPHVSTRLFSTLLQVHAGDSVLDLGTGNGFLLLDAVRRGATGLGIDLSERALAFARANALLNGLGEEVRFQIGDMSRPPFEGEWEKPTVVISSVPSEPIPEGFNRPMHSDGGPDGMKLLKDLLSSLAQWSHRPSVIQLVMFSLGQPLTRTGEHICATGILAHTADSIGATVELNELLRPISIEDYLLLYFGGGRYADGEEWLSELSRNGFVTLHLLSANFYLGSPTSIPTAVRWTPHREIRWDEESFLRPRVLTHGPESSQANATEIVSDPDYRSDLDGLMVAREHLMAEKAVNLMLDNDVMQKFLTSLLCNPVLFDGKRPLILLDVSRTSERESRLQGFCIDKDGKQSFWPSYSDVAAYLTETGGKLGATVCDVIRQKPYINHFIKVNMAEPLLEDLQSLSKEVVQRFAVITDPDGCLPYDRRILFANTFSESALKAKVINDLTLLERSKKRNEELGEAIQIFASITHEVGALFKKHFPTVRLDLEKEPNKETMLRAAHAWDVIYATVELASLFAKAVTSKGPAIKDQLKNRFCAPLSELREQGQLELALSWIAKRVYDIEHRQPNVRIDSLERFEAPDPALSAQQFASCYVLTAEPIRNLCNYGTNVEAEWSVMAAEDGGTTIKLEYDHRTHKPNSITFENLNKFLQTIEPGCFAKALWVVPLERLCWQVTLIPEFFNCTKSSG